MDLEFAKLGIIAPILRALDEQGYKRPTPVQEAAIPSILRGRDLLGSAQTGTGKTAAFAVPILQALCGEERGQRSKRSIKALVLTPTRELAVQIDESFASYGRYTGLKHIVIYGGVSQVLISWSRHPVDCSI